LAARSSESPAVPDSVALFILLIFTADHARPRRPISPNVDLSSLSRKMPKRPLESTEETPPRAAEPREGAIDAGGQSEHREKRARVEAGEKDAETENRGLMLIRRVTARWRGLQEAKKELKERHQVLTEAKRGLDDAQKKYTAAFEEALSAQGAYSASRNNMQGSLKELEEFCREAPDPYGIEELDDDDDDDDDDYDDDDDNK